MNASYQGWTNYETWAVNLWLNNEEATVNHWNDAAREQWEVAADPDLSDLPASFTRSERARAALSDMLKNDLDEGMPDEINDACANTVYADLLNAALREVNWREIANSFLAAVEEAYESQEFTVAE